MSSLSRNPGLRTGRTLAGAFALLLVRMAHGQTAIVPYAQLIGEWDTNRLLSPNHSKSGEWGEAQVASDIEHYGPRSELKLRPQMNYQESSYSSLNRFEASLNLSALYRTQRTIYSVSGSYFRQDAYNAEYGVAQFNPYNPGAPDTVGTGEVVTGITRNSYNLSPDVVHKFTERLSGEFSGDYTEVHYSRQITQTLTNFRAPLVNLYAVYALSQRSSIGVGPFYQRFDPTDSLESGTLPSQTYGANISYRYLTSQLTHSNLNVKVGRTQQDQFLGPARTQTTWGVDWTGVWQMQTSRLQYSIGRLIEPSSIGGQVSLDQIRVQYNQNLSRRLSASVSARISRQEALSNGPGHRDRSYGDAYLRYALTPKWDLTGGYRFAWQRLPQAVDSTVIYNAAQSHGVYLSIGYHGINPYGH